MGTDRLATPGSSVETMGAGARTRRLCTHSAGDSKEVQAGPSVECEGRTWVRICRTRAVARARLGRGANGAEGLSSDLSERVERRAVGPLVRLALGEGVPKPERLVAGAGHDWGRWLTSASVLAVASGWKVYVLTWP